MEKSLFTILLVFWSIGVSFGSYKYFVEPELRVGARSGSNSPDENRFRQEILFEKAPAVSR